MSVYLRFTFCFIWKRKHKMHCLNSSTFQDYTMNLLWISVFSHSPVMMSHWIQCIHWQLKLHWQRLLNVGAVYLCSHSTTQSHKILTEKWEKHHIPQIQLGKLVVGPHTEMRTLAMWMPPQISCRALTVGKKKSWIQCQAAWMKWNKMGVTHLQEIE